ncbi:hypothetical protein T11_12105 [Trichinella zimbabwensis]|uniref:Uncharacterized protein n=1 Tax=Trichinella zimbabwensis TaxID=268475 RepID=A0A0V1HRF4_9BILA|nr:hypothetical protein T11_12105 [Trichinella zimbabwensis]
MIRINLERKAQNSNARPNKNEFDGFVLYFKSPLQNEVNAKRSTFPLFRFICLAQSVMSSFMPNRNLLPNSDVYLVCSSIGNTGSDMHKKSSPFPVQNFSKQKISDSRPYLIFDSSVSCDESLTTDKHILFNRMCTNSCFAHHLITLERKALNSIAAPNKNKLDDLSIVYNRGRQPSLRQVLDAM